jgi:hypothetical protein
LADEPRVTRYAIDWTGTDILAQTVQSIAIDATTPLVDQVEGEDEECNDEEMEDDEDEEEDEDDDDVNADIDIDIEEEDDEEEEDEQNGGDVNDGENNNQQMAFINEDSMDVHAMQFEHSHGAHNSYSGPYQKYM